MRYVLWSSLSPSQLIVMVTILGALLLPIGRGRLGRWLSMAGGAALLLLGVLPTAQYLLEPLQERFPQPNLPARLDGIVLMAGAEAPAKTERYGEPQLSRHGGRYTTALRLAQRYPQVKLVFVGGPFRDPDSGALAQAGVARELLVSLGVDPRRLVFETRSTDTCDSAENALRLLGPRPTEAWAVVTSAAHMPRTMACFRAAGWEPIPQPADYQADLGGLRTSVFRAAENLLSLDIALHEWIGLAYYRLSGRTLEFFPAPRPGSARPLPKPSNGVTPE